MKAVSVVIPAHNAAKTIATTLASLASEAGVIGEILLVDDESSDGTTAVALQTAAKLSLPLRVLPANCRDAGGARNETRLRGLLFDQYRRGYRSGACYIGTTGAKPFRLARNNFRDRRQIRKLARIGLSGPELSFAMRSMPIVVLALFAKSLGIYLGARDRLKNDLKRQDD